MNITEIYQTILQLSHAAWDCAATVGGWFSAELLCSMTVNITILAAVLFGAVRLFAPVRVKEQADSRRNPLRRG
ncbi:hypothetical protein BerOc1_02056 [Pseudodesulfovibrio hydrargyri]|uniref:Uncharacterized protein n=1 Tax=Pseudodesulfovibrio hydrargyri TaxID=2125990 RepID=A0A1J5MU17_9BACT|nr:hypothetical protein [Pseudodesulfovibrio hydrargyri]OIQ50126.1 hypothetical protein BerOc1_02056 [Pseudodesulfovibrio hydrargyri]